LRKGDVLLKLQPQPFKVLLLLVERASQLVTREEIQRFLWKDSTFVDFQHGINFSINQIRGALADDAESPRYVETLPRRGYRFIGTVETPFARRPSVVSGPVEVEKLAALEHGLEPNAKRKTQGPSLALTAWTVLVLALAGAAYFVFHRALVLTDRDTLVLAHFTDGRYRV
jgi:DNA-binding winged helix-turn-helix (wHTH) protein